MTQITAQQLSAHLQKPLQRLYILCGEEPLQQLESADAIRAALGNQEEVERQIFTVAGAHFDWSSVMAGLRGLSLFARQQLIDIRIPSGKPGREGGQALQQLAQEANQLQDTLILISIPQPLDRATKNTAWFKALLEQGVVVLCDPVDMQALPRWLTQRMQQAGLQVESGEDGRRAITFLAEHVEGNLLAAHQEIEKIRLLYCDNSVKTITLTSDQIQNSVMNVARYNLFDLPQTVLSGQVSRALKMLEGLSSEGVALVRIHWALANELTSLWAVRQGLDEGKPLPLALKDARIWGDRERLYTKVLTHLSSKDCLRLLRAAQACDGIVKGLPFPGWPSDPGAAVRRLMLEILDATCAKQSGERLFLKA